ncbi:MAG: DUF433 domain-containing protein [Gloeomargarita sp. SKYG98]|nr:DUF433 domain-containing protein [Gloeomargarita sp. SKYG98]
MSFTVIGSRLWQMGQRLQAISQSLLAWQVFTDLPSVQAFTYQDGQLQLEGDSDALRQDCLRVFGQATVPQSAAVRYRLFLLPAGRYERERVAKWVGGEVPLGDALDTLSTPPRITLDPSQMGGVPCIRHLRIPVATVVGLLAEGLSVADVLAAYPDLQPEDIQEALRYAAAACTQ